MSDYDFIPHKGHYTATSRTPRAPASMGYPDMGVFQLIRLNFGEVYEGPMASREHAHAVYHLVLFVEGANQFLIDGRLRECEPGLCMLAGPGVSHAFPPRNRGRVAYHALTFTFRRSGKGSPRLPSWEELLQHHTGLHTEGIPAGMVLPHTTLAELDRLLGRLRAQLPPATPTRSARVHCLLHELFVVLAEPFMGGADLAEPGAAPPEVRAQQLLDADYMTGPRLSEVAEQLGVTTAHLGRAFKRRFGVSPARYRDTLRMEAATSLLQHSDLLVKQIAYELGYPDASTFSKAFHRHCGHSPTDLRDGGHGTAH